MASGEGGCTAVLVEPAGTSAVRLRLPRGSLDISHSGEVRRRGGLDAQARYYTLVAR